MGDFDESLKVAATQGDIRAIKKEVSGMAEKLSEIYQALVGNPLSDDGGLVKRLQICEKKLNDQDARIEAIEKKDVQSDLYLKIIWGLGGVVITAALAFIFNHVFKP